MKHVNIVVVRIIELNDKIYDLKKKHKHGKTSFLRTKTSTLRYSKCEGYKHDSLVMKVFWILKDFFFLF